MTPLIFSSACLGTVIRCMHLYIIIFMAWLISASWATTSFIHGCIIALYIIAIYNIISYICKLSHQLLLASVPIFPCMAGARFHLSSAPTDVLSTARLPAVRKCIAVAMKWCDIFPLLLKHGGMRGLYMHGGGSSWCCSSGGGREADFWR